MTRIGAPGTLARIFWEEEQKRMKQKKAVEQAELAMARMVLERLGKCDPEYLSYHERLALSNAQNTIAKAKMPKAEEK